MKHKLESRLLGEIQKKTLRYEDDTTLMAESKELKILLIKVEKDSEKADLKLNIRKLRSQHPTKHFMANKWGNNGNSDTLYFLGSKITAGGDCSHEIKRHLLLGRRAMTNQDSMLKSKNITLPAKSI